MKWLFYGFEVEINVSGQSNFIEFDQQTLRSPNRNE